MACSDEEGEYFAVDIGGTNYRVIYVKLSERKSEVVSAARTHHRILGRTPLTLLCEPYRLATSADEPSYCMPGVL